MKNEEGKRKKEKNAEMGCHSAPATSGEESPSVSRYLWMGILLPVSRDQNDSYGVFFGDSIINQSDETGCSYSWE